MDVLKSTGLAKTSQAVRHLATRLDKARQLRNERVARADADYVEAVRRALADVETGPVTIAVVLESPPQDAASA
jgi:hypothetical protein